jgi:hypothetical protein
MSQESIENINMLFGDTQRKNLRDMNNMAPSLSKVSENYDVNKSSIKGLVQIHETNSNGERELVTESSNLIVYPGRSLALCRMFGKDLDWGNPTKVEAYKNLSDAYIAWFAVGTKGSSTENSQSPLIVNSTDYGLGGDGSGHGSLTGATTKLITVYGRQYLGFDDGYPKFIAEPEILNNEDITNSLRNVTIGLNSEAAQWRDSYLIANVQVTLGSNTANGTGTQEISECGLFLAPRDYAAELDTDSTWRSTSSATYTDGGVTKSSYKERHLEMFARVTFPTITKTASRSFTISWYIFF